MKVLLFCSLVCFQFSGLFSKPKVVCYWPGWRLEGTLKHTPEDIDPTLCTHIHYAFYVLDDQNNVVKDKFGAQPDVYHRLQALKQKNPDIKIIVSMGGDGEPDVKYSHLVNNEALRHQFIKNTIQYLHKYKFDGFDIDWEYPVCWGGNCNRGPQSDRENFGKFVQELRAAFDKETPRLSLSAAVVAGLEGGVVDHAYDFKSIGANLDYISVMTYGGTYSQTTGHNSKFEFCKSATQYYFTKHGVPKEKLLIGAALYGHTYTLADKDKHYVGAPIVGRGKAPGGDGDATFYRQICNLVKRHGWTKEQSDHGHDPIAYHDLLWIGYDDPYAVYEKSKWAKDNGYGGMIVWEISQDDFKKSCCSVTYPLLRAINHGLYGTGNGPETYGCEHK